MTASLEVSPGDAQGPYIVALDVGSSGTRGGVYDAAARPVRGARAKRPHAFITLADGTSIIDPDQVTDEIGSVIDEVLQQWGGPIAGVALDTFASSLVGVDAHGAAITPCYTYADSRCAPQVNYLTSILDEDATQQRTGTRQHTGYLPPRFLWLQQNDPQTFAQVRRWMSVGEYVWLRLIGTTAAGTSTAAWTGMLNRRSGTWDAELCTLVGVQPEQLSAIAPPSRPLTPRTSLAQRWPRLNDAAWFAPISDGHSQSIGAGSVDSSTAVLSAATSGAVRVLVRGDLDNLPRGLWCNRIDEQRSILGGALNDVGRAVTWLHDTLNLPSAGELDAVMAAAPAPGLPVVLPWFSGERSTGWVGEARAVFHQVSAATTPLELYRATLEGVALSYVRVLRELTAVTGQPHQIVATGHVAATLPSLLQMVADAAGVPVVPGTLKRSTLRGTALTALPALDAAAAAAPAPQGSAFMPHPDRLTYYHRRLERFGVLYDKVIAHAN